MRELGDAGRKKDDERPRKLCCLAAAWMRISQAFSSAPRGAADAGFTALAPLSRCRGSAPGPPAPRNRARVAAGSGWCKRVAAIVQQRSNDSLVSWRHRGKPWRRHRARNRCSNRFVRGCGSCCSLASRPAARRRRATPVSAPVGVGAVGERRCRPRDDSCASASGRPAAGSVPLVRKERNRPPR